MITKKKEEHSPPSLHPPPCSMKNKSLNVNRLLLLTIIAMFAIEKQNVAEAAMSFSGGTSHTIDSTLCTGYTFSCGTNSQATWYTFMPKVKLTGQYTTAVCNSTATSCFISTLIMVRDFGVVPGGTVTVQVQQGKATDQATTTEVTSTSTSLIDISWANFTTFSATVNTATSFKLAWNGIGLQNNNYWNGGSQVSVTGYKIEYQCPSCASTAWSTFATVTGASTISLTTAMPSSSLLWNTLYNFKISTVNKCGLGKFPGTAAITTALIFPTVAPVLTLDGSTDTLVSFSWNEISTANADNGGDVPVGYVFERALSSSLTTWTQMQNSTSLTYSFNPSTIGLAASTKYSYRVYADNGATLGTETYSNIIEVMNLGAPLKPATPTVLFQGCTYVTYKWSTYATLDDQGGTWVTDYSLQEKKTTSSTWRSMSGTNNQFTNVLGNTTITYTQLYSADSWTTGNQYDFQYKASNNIGDSVLSDTLTITFPVVPTTAMSSVSILSADITPTTILITWTVPTGAAAGYCEIKGYVLEYALASSSTYTALTTNTYNTTTYTHSVSGLLTNTAYKYQIKVSTLAYASTTYSTATSITTDGPPTVMGALTAGVVNPMNITVSWSDLTSNSDTGRDPITFYLLMWYNPTTSTWNNLTTEGGAKILTFTHAKGSLFSSTVTAQYKVQPRNAVGWGTATSAILAIVTDKVPQLMSTLTAGTIAPWSMTFSWTALTTDAQHGGDIPYYYKVEWESSTGIWVEISSLANGIKTSITHVKSSIFVSNSNTNYRVTPINDVGTGIVTSTITMVADREPQVAPVLASVSVAPKEVKISWPDITVDASVGRDQINFFLVEWDQGIASWVPLNVNGTDARVIAFTHTRATVFTANSKIYYRAKALNGVGYGPVSTSLEILTDNIPTAMGDVTVASISAASITLSWTDITDPLVTGRDTVIFYQLNMRLSQSDAWTAKTSLGVNGKVTSFTVVHATQLIPDQWMYFQVCAQNGVGMGACSAEKSAQAPTAPKLMKEPVITAANINAKSIYITWPSVTLETETGRDPIIYYGIEWDQGTGVWTNLTNSAVGLANFYNMTISPTTNVYTPNAVFKFRCYAKNNVGLGPYSNEVSMTTDNVPQALATPINTSITYNSIVLSWAAATDDGRDAVIYYQVQFYNRPCYASDAGDCASESLGLGSWTEISSQATQGAALTFTHSIATHFHPNSDFKYRVCGKNTVGLGLCSSEITVTTDNVPQALATPTNTNIDYNSIGLSWAVATDDGRDPIIYYKVEFYDRPCYALDASDCTSELLSLGAWTEISTEAVQGVTRTFTHSIATHFHANSDFKYRICGKNGVGLGLCSTEITVTTDNVPQAMATPTNTNIVYNSIDLAWAVATDDGRDPIIYYKVEFFNRPCYAADANDCTAELITDGAWTEISTQLVQGTTRTFTHSIATHFHANSGFQYRICGKNSVGLGLCSTQIIVTTDNVPQAMATPISTSIVYNSIGLSWAVATDDGGDPIIYYRVEFFSRPCYASDAGDCTTELLTDGAWTEISTEAVQGVTRTFTHSIATHFHANSAFKYRICGKNGVGLGACSSELTVTTDNVPQALSTPISTSIIYNSIGLSWAVATDDGRDPINYYRVEFFDRPCYASDSGDCTSELESLGVWTQISTKAVQATTLTFTHTSLTHFHANSAFKYRICGENGVGAGACSTVLIVTTDDVPAKMATPLNVTVVYNQIQVKFAPMSSDADQGRDIITSYRLVWDDYLYYSATYYPANVASVPWVSLGTYNQNTGVSYFTHTHIINPSFTANKQIMYRVQALNGVGYGPLSDPLEIVTDDVPYQMTIPACATTTAILPDSITITWSAAAADKIGGDTVVYYSLEWDEGDATKLDAAAWTELSDPGAATLLYTFTQSPSGSIFPNNTDFRYRVRAKNGVGFGAYSPTLTITADRTPLKPAAATNGVVNPQSIVVSWVHVTNYDQTGRDPITHYLVQFNDGTGWVDLIEYTRYTLTYTHSISVPFPANVDRSTYNVLYRVIGRNTIGYGMSSDDLAVETDTFPAQMVAPTVSGTITPTSLTIAWTKLTTSNADTGRDPITDYQLEWLEITSPTTTNWVILTTATSSTSSYFVSSSNFNINTYYRARVAAINGVGLGQYSSELLVLTDGKPTRMNTPTEDSTTNANLIKVNWVGILDDADTGRDTVISYKLEWDQGTGSWQTLKSGTLIYTFSITTNSDGVQNGTTYLFRVTPKNSIGNGVSSLYLSVIPSSPPDKMNSISTSIISITSTSVRISWTEPQTNGAAITSYDIMIKATDGVYYQSLVTCDGSTSTVRVNRYCDIPMTTLRATPFLLVKGAGIYAKANAANIKGYNASYSTANTATNYIETEPLTPSTPYRGGGTTDAVLQAQWSGIGDFNSNSGGTFCAISSYHVQRNQGNSSGADTWTDIQGLASNSTSTTATTSSGIVGGTTYKVRVRAYNKFGWGPYSATFNLRCAKTPSAPPSIVTVNSTTYIQVTWTTPYNNGLDITKYLIEINKRSSSNWATPGECDGSDPTIFAAKTCWISMTTFRTSSFNTYLYDETPVIRVSAYNLEGFGSTTSSSGGAKIQTEPLAPSVTLTNDVASTNDFQIKLYWTQISGVSNWRGYEVHAYEVWWTDKDNSFPYELLYNDTKPYVQTYTHKNKNGVTPATGDTSYTTMPIIGGTRYKFKYRATNIHGPGPFSTEVMFYASTVPDQLASASTSLLNQTVTTQWAATPNDHKTSVTAYRVKYRNKAGTFVEDTSICNGVKSTVVSSYSCSALMILFTTNLNLAIDDLIVVQVEAMNVMGYSAPSPSNTVGIPAKKLPQTAPTNLQRGVDTGKTQVHITFTGISANVDTGGQAVDYKIYFDKNSLGVNWYTLTETTTNLTTYTDNANFIVGKNYQFKIAAFNDFGIGPQSTAFTIWSAIAPSGLADPTTTLNLLTYVEEDDDIVIDWVPPTDDGGLAVSYKIEVKQGNGVWAEIDQTTECSEKSIITNYFIPQAITANAATQCTILVAKLKSKYLLNVGDTVVTRITAFHVVGSVTTTMTGTGNAVLPVVPCFRTTFPRIVGGSMASSSISAFDVDSLGNIAIGGTTQDSGMLGKSSAVALPYIIYVAKGNFFVFGKYLETNDGVTANLFNNVLDITFRFDNQKILAALDRSGYGQAITIVILNLDGTVYGSFKEGLNIKGKVNVTSMMYDSSNFVTLALDVSQDGTDTKKYATIVRFSVANPTAASITPTFYIQGGVAGKVSQALTLQRIKSDATAMYASAMIQDINANRRSLLAKITLATGAVSKYYQYTTASTAADYNTDASIAVIRKMSLYEDDISTMHIISACIASNDGQRPHFGQFLISTSQLFTVLTPSTKNRWLCLGMYQRYANMAYVVYNDRSTDTSAGYTLWYGRIDYNNKKIDSIPILNHDGANNYYGATFMHLGRFYYWGDTLKQITSTTYPFSVKVGFLNIFDIQETLSCVSGSQNYNNFAAGGVVTTTLDNIVTSNMNWLVSAYSSGPTLTTQSGKSFKPFTLSGGIYNLNLVEPILNNTWCPIVTTPSAVTINPPTIIDKILLYNPDALSYPPQERTFSPFTYSRSCPDESPYFASFLSDTSLALPSFITFDSPNSKYIFNINIPSHVGVYQIMLQSTIGNNKTTSVKFTVQVASPCLGLTINVPVLAVTPSYDISDLVPMYVDLNWEVVSPPTPSCGEIFFIFKMLNNTAGGVVDSSVFSIVNTTSGLQKIKVWTQSIPAAKLWVDIKIEARLQGDLVRTFVYSILITNKCAATVISPVTIPSQIYYTGRDPIDFTFVWSENIGTCGPISYYAREYLSATTSSNNSLDSGVFAYPKPSGANNTLRIYTWDDSKVGTYQVRVFASLGVGGYKQSDTIFSVSIIKDPCCYYDYKTSFVEDLTLWIDQANQVVNIPPFTMNDTSWVCNFTYELRSSSGTVLDSIFVLKEAANEGDGTNITLVTSDITKADISPQGIRVRGFPKRQNMTSAFFTFRIFLAFLVKNDCSSGTYYDVAADMCKDCISPCSTCQTSATQCTWCIAGYIYLSQTNTCVLPASIVDCPVNTFKDPYFSSCRSCPNFCSDCSDISTCTACIPGYNLVNAACYPKKTCPEGYRNENDQCLSCSANCAVCPTGTKCHYCSFGSYLDVATQQCVTDCPSGYFGDAGSRVCMLCSPACSECVGNNYTCTACRPIGATKYYLFQQTCVTRCPYLGYTQNETAAECQNCLAECKICVNAKDDCIVCNPGSVISGRECLNKCPDGKYITAIGTCFDCDPSCAKCSGPQNSMCSLCVNGQFLTQTTCEPRCTAPLYADNATGTCLACNYYCNQCTSPTNCAKCKTGYIQVPNDCSGENYLRVLSTQPSVSVPLNPAIVNDAFNPTQAAVEVWFKADNIMSLGLEIIVGLSPYKFRKKAGVAQVQINWGDLNYCDTTNLKSNQWYHFGFSISEDLGGSLACYLDGEKVLIGQAPVAAITSNVDKFKEINFGTSIDIKTSESKFNGYLKEFRWWKKVRSQFQFQNFRQIGLTDILDFQPPNQLISYWKFEEKRSDPKLIDFASNGLVLYDPVASIGKTVAEILEMREIFLKMCPEGTYALFNETLNMITCLNCHADCKNCNGDTNTSCTSCKSPNKLLETEQTCISNPECPFGYWKDINSNCWPCHPYCTVCYGNDQFQCTACKKGFFKAYRREGCVSSCPRGLYGNYLTQSCSANPIVTSIYPEDNSIIAYGTFIDLFATYNVLNDEPDETFTFNWIITRVTDTVDVAKDAAKNYSGFNMTRVHLDNNIIMPNNYYNITFYVKGDDLVYNGMIGSMFNVIYIGIPPKKGVCFINPPQGIATVTDFILQTGQWDDKEGISEFRFFYSFDQGETYLPIEQQTYQINNMKYRFQPIFKTVNAMLKCQVRNIKGFYAYQETNFVLIKRSTSNAKLELEKLNITSTQNEQQSLTTAYSIQQIAQELGGLKTPPKDLFDPQIKEDACTVEMCGFNGECKFDTFTNKYYCACYGERAGKNCTFKTQAELEILQTLAVKNAKQYTAKSQGGFDASFIKIASGDLDLMTDDLFDKVHDIVYEQILGLQQWKSDDPTQAQSSIEILSNMLEFIEHSLAVNNQTNSWNATGNATIYQEQQDRVWDNLKRTMTMANMVKESTRYQLTDLQPTIQLTSRMVSVKQLRTTSDRIVSMPATGNINKQQTSFVKISPANFVNSTVKVQKDIVIEAVEYAVNPFQITNDNRVAANVFEVNMYNHNKTVVANDLEKIDVQNLTVPIELYFPVSDNKNLSQFLVDYNALSPYRYRDRLKREEMIVKSGISCVYWDMIRQAWSTKGCKVAGLDTTHIKCACNHLSAFTITFTTPKLTIDAPQLENTTTKAGKEVAKVLTLSDIIKWPLDLYFNNMLKLWQHNRPSVLSFLIKPGFIVLVMFWAMYLSSLIYYSGRDNLRRESMTKSQNRDDLAEMKDDEAQHLDKVVRDLIVRDFLNDNGRFIAKEARKASSPTIIGSRKKKQPPQIKIYEQLSKDEQKKYRNRARRKVFGMPGTMCERAFRFYKKTMKHAKTDPNAKMAFFNEELKNNLWIGLIAKTSKIAPRHVRLALMYFYASLYILALTIIFGFQIQELITDMALFQVIALAFAVHIGALVITIPVAAIFRMPLDMRKQIAGVRTKKINKVFKEIDAQMGCRYAIGYFICLTTYFLMTIAVIIFNIFYPHDYVMGWVMNIILLYIFDLILFSFGLAAIQLGNVIISSKVKCWYNVWATIEVFRYLKNLRG